MISTGIYHKKASNRVTDDDVQTEAYYLWERAGRPNGMSDFFWGLAKERCGAAPEPDPNLEEKRELILHLIRECGADAWKSVDVKNLAASVGINMDRL